MYGLIVKLKIVSGKRDEFMDLLRQSAYDMPGCLSYIVAKDSSDENTVWVTEVWDNPTSHEMSLLLPRVKEAIPRAKAIVSNFERIAITTPVWGVGLNSSGGT